jgi:hypothetical protein
MLIEANIVFAWPGYVIKKKDLTALIVVLMLNR